MIISNGLDVTFEFDWVGNGTVCKHGITVLWQESKDASNLLN